MIDHRLTDREWAEEWKHLDNVRISIVAMFNVHPPLCFTQKCKAVKKGRGRQVIKVSFSAKDGMQMTGTGLDLMTDRAASVPSESEVDGQLTLGGLCQCGELNRHLSGFLAPNSMNTKSCILHTHSQTDAHTHIETGPQMELRTQQRAAPAGESS